MLIIFLSCPVSYKFMSFKPYVLALVHQCRLKLQLWAVLTVSRICMKKKNHFSHFSYLNCAYYYMIPNYLIKERYCAIIIWYLIS